MCNHSDDSRARTVGRVAGLCAISFAVASCTPPQPAAFDPHTFDRSARAAATELQESRPKAALPTTLQATSIQRPRFGTVEPNAPIVRLTLQEVIQRAASPSSKVGSER